MYTIQKQLVPFAEYAEALYPNVIAMPAILGFGLVYSDKISSIFLDSKCMNKSCNKGRNQNRKYLYTMPVKCSVVGKPLCIQVYPRDLINPTCHLEMKVTFTFGAKSRLRI